MQVRISKKTKKLITNCEKLYREHHPELDEIYISNNKMIYEIAKFYLKDTKYEEIINNG